MKRIGKIYVLRDPQTLEIRYCGQTIRDLNIRLKGHVKSSLNKSGRLTHKESWIRSLGECMPIIEMIEECPESTLDEREIFHIARLREETDQLTNTTDGGNGIRIRGKRHWNYGKVLSDDTKAKIGNANRGENNGMRGKSITPSKETRIRRSNSLRSSVKMELRNKNPEWKRKISQSQIKLEKVKIIDNETDDILFTFDTIAEAASELGCSRANLRHAFHDSRLIGKKLKTLGGKKCRVEIRNHWHD